MPAYPDLMSFVDASVASFGIFITRQNETKYRFATQFRFELYRIVNFHRSHCMWRCHVARCQHDCEQKQIIFYSRSLCAPFRREIAGDVHFSLFHLFYHFIQCKYVPSRQPTFTSDRDQSVKIIYTVFRRHLSQAIIVWFFVWRATVGWSFTICALWHCGIDCMCLFGAWAIYQLIFTFIFYCIPCRLDGEHVIEEWR